MKPNLPDELIEAYLKGKMTPSEREQFEKMLGEDLEFAEKVALQRAEMAAAELLIASETRQMFQQWQAEKKPVLSGKTSLLVGGMGIVTVLLLLFFLPQWRHRKPAVSEPHETIVPPPSSSPQLTIPERPVATAPAPSSPAPKPARDYFALARQQLQDPLSANLRQFSSGDSIVSVFQQAQRAYAAGRYRQTLDLLAQTDTTRQQSGIFLSAHALFQLRRFEAAAEQFNRLIALNSRQFRFRSEWGLLMCRLAELPQGEKEFRKQLDTLLTQLEHPYWQQAKDLQKALRD